MHELAEAFSSASRKHSLQLASCCERIDLSRYGIMHNKCVDNELVARISSRELVVQKRLVSALGLRLRGQPRHRRIQYLCPRLRLLLRPARTDRSYRLRR